MLAELDGHPVVARQGNLLVAAFHPELTDDLRLHALFLALWRAERGKRARACDEGPARRGARARSSSQHSCDVKEGDVCLIQGETAAEPLALAVYEEVLQARRPARSSS